MTPTQALLRLPRGPVAAQREGGLRRRRRRRDRALADHVIPDDSAATISFVETPTAELPEIDADLLDDSQPTVDPVAERSDRPPRS